MEKAKNIRGKYLILSPVLTNNILTSDGDGGGVKKGAVNVGGSALVEARLFQEGGGDAEGDGGRGVGVAPQKLLPVSP